MDTNTRNYKKVFLITIIGVAVVWLGGNSLVYALAGLNVTYSPTNSAIIPAAAIVTDTHKKEIEAMQHTLDSIVARNSSMDVAVSVVDLRTGASYDHGVEAPFGAASTIKVLSAALYLHKVEQGTATLSKKLNGVSAQKQLEDMIEQSDNNAWKSINDYLGHPALMAYAKEIGMQQYNPEGHILTSHDLALLLAKLYNKQLLNETHTNQLLGYMKTATTQGYLAASVPTGATLYSKAGWLDDRFNEGSIVTSGSGSYVLVIFSKSHTATYDATAGKAVYKAINQAVTKALAAA
jgi:beta-lactamase class A